MQRRSPHHSVYTFGPPPEWKCFLHIAMHVTTVKNSLVTKLIIVSKAMDPVLNAFEFSGLTHLPFTVLQVARSLGMRLYHSFLITFYTWVYTCTCTHKHYLLIGCCKPSINNSMTWTFPCSHATQLTNSATKRIYSVMKEMQSPSFNCRANTLTITSKEQTILQGTRKWQICFSCFVTEIWDELLILFACSQPLLSFLSLGESLWTKLSFCYKAHFDAYAHSTSPFHCCRPFNMLTRSCIIWRKGDQGLKSLSYA